MLQDIRNNFIVILLGLVFTLIPASLAQAAPAAVNLNQSVISMETIEGKPSVMVTELSEGALVKVYDQVSGKLLGSAIVKTGQTSAIVSLTSFNNDVDVTVTLESARVELAIGATATLESGVTIINNSGMADTVTVADLEVGDIVKVYDVPVLTDPPTAPKLLGQATVAKGKTEAVVIISQLGTFVGDVNVTLTSIGKKESAVFVKTYGPEVVTDILLDDNITVINNASSADTVIVTNLEVGDIVKVYDAPLEPAISKLLGTATVGKDKDEAVVSIRQLGTVAGKIRVSLTSLGKRESDKSNVISYDEEPQSYSLGLHNITVINNAGLADTVTVTDLEGGDIVKVYSAAGRLTGKATVAKGKTETVVSIRQLGTGAGEVKIAVTSIGKIESDKLTKPYSAEAVTPAPDDISVTNNKGSNDTVEVTGLEVGDIVKVYKASRLVGKSTADVGGIATVSIRQLGTEEGTVSVSVTRKGEQESTKVDSSYLEELED